MMAMLAEQSLFDPVFHAAGGKWRRICLIAQGLSKKSHRPVTMMQGNIVDTGNCVVTVPPTAGPVRSGDDQSMQHCEKNSPLNIEFKLPVGKLISENYRQSKFHPEAFENQHRSDFDGMGVDINFTVDLAVLDDLQVLILTWFFDTC
jgi:hypothetical protein